MDSGGLVLDTGADTEGRGIIGGNRIQHAGKPGGTSWQCGRAALQACRWRHHRSCWCGGQDAGARNALCTFLRVAEIYARALGIVGAIQ